MREPTKWGERPSAQGKQGAIVSVKGTDQRIVCPACGDAPIVYNGNYFCDDWGGECDWALPHPATRRRDRDICDLLGIDYE